MVNLSVNLSGEPKFWTLVLNLISKILSRKRAGESRDFQKSPRTLGHLPKAVMRSSNISDIMTHNSWHISSHELTKWIHPVYIYTQSSTYLTRKLLILFAKIGDYGQRFVLHIYSKVGTPQQILPYCSTPNNENYMVHCQAKLYMSSTLKTDLILIVAALKY